MQDPARAAAERGLKLALGEMVTTEKLTPAQAGEMYAITFPEEGSEETRFEAYLRENPRVAQAISVGRLTREQALAGFRARAGEKEASREALLKAAHRKLLAAEPELGRTPREKLMPRLEQMIADGLVDAGTEPPNHERVMAFGLYCNDLIESGQIERFDPDLQKVYDIANAEMLRQGTLVTPGAQEPAAGSIRNLAFSVYEVEVGNWDQVLGKTLLLSEAEPLARGRAASGLLDLQLRDQALPDRAGRASFAMRFEGLLTAREAGQYTFRLMADDQAQLFLNGKLAASYHGNAQGAAKVVEVALAEGDHKLRVDFADWGGAWWLELVMTEPGGQEVALSKVFRGFEGEGRDRRRAKMKLAVREPVPVDWDAEYETFLGANPKVKEQVEAGRITKDQVLAGLKARAKEVEPDEDPEVAALLARFEAMRPGSGENLRKMLAEGRLKKEDLLARLDGRGVRARAQEPKEPMKGKDEPAPGRGADGDRGGEAPAPEAKRPSREEYAKAAAEIEAAVAAGNITAEQGREKLAELRRSMAKRRAAPKRVDWDAEYEAFLKANSKVREQVAAGKITKDQVLAGLKARAKEAEPEKDTELEGILARFEAMRPGSAESLRQSLAEGRITKEALLARLKGAEARGLGRGDGGDDPKGSGDEPPPKRGGGEKRSGKGDGEKSKRGDGGR